MALTELANSQWGVVARRQLGAIGLTPTMVRDRIERGRLTRLHRGVYVVGHRQLRPRAHTLAAVLAVGPGAVASHRDAAWLHGLRPGGHARSDVTTTRRGVTGGPRIAVHRTTVLTDEDVTEIDGIPVTSLARTLVDLAAVVPADHLAKALSEAERLLLLDMRSLERAIERTRNRTGSGHASLRAVLADHAAHGVEHDRSTMERRFAALVRDAGLPRPKLNHWIEGVEVDAVWPRERVAVELDSWTWHRHRRAFQRDREKGNTLTAAGWTVLRFTYLDVVDRPREVAAQLVPLVASVAQR
ncbi:type IV toxin-antitoxin system AbiEi family antitoxin domain-containing protein [Conexibacter arvalis]|uniref:type IV toxin-antitoxin system AbiEi family antitoxin domain-containing protein n=1 Tax=Conexibacter arvalis TaxID=912552 RepID=UPI0031B5882B